MVDLDLLDKVEGVDQEREDVPDFIATLGGIKASTMPSTDDEFQERYRRLLKLGASEKQAAEGARDALAFHMHRLFFLGKL